MSTLENAPTQPTPAITEQRLWFLYCVAGLLKREIEERTGWKRSQIDYRLGKWRLHMWADGYIDAEDLRQRMGAVLRRRFLSGEVSWAEIDAFDRPACPHCRGRG